MSFLGGRSPQPPPWSLDEIVENIVSIQILWIEDLQINLIKNVEVTKDLMEIEKLTLNLTESPYGILFRLNTWLYTLVD